jgi:hypothetical protein
MADEIHEIPYRRLPPPSQDDLGMLRMLSVCYMIGGGLLFISGLGITLSSLPDRILTLIGAAILVISSSLFISGLGIFRRRLRVFSLVVAAVALLVFPLGTALGGLTLYVLLKPGVQQIYRTARSL